jgi:mannose-6-phosphate isomerase-like protein (cupin superfamily)
MGIPGQQIKIINMPEKYNYNQQMNIKYAHLELIDVPAIVAENKLKWFNQTLTQINESVARIGIVEGEYHWHKHDDDDEFFFVLEGKLFVDLEDRTIELEPMQGVTVGKGVVHRTRAPKKTVMLMVETAAIDPIGD